MATIQDTITQGMRTAGFQQYQRQAQPIVDALVQREQQIAQALMTEATNRGLSADETTRLFEGVGLTLPAQAAAAEGGDLARRVTSLETFARRNGYRG